MIRSIKLSEIASIFGLEFHGEDVVINGLNLCNRESEYDSILSYVISDRFIKNVRNNIHISVLIIKEEDKDYYTIESIGRDISYIIAEMPEAIFYKIHEHLFKKTDFYDKYEFKSIIGQDCIISESAFIEDGVIIGNRVIIGHNSTIKHGSVIGDDVVIGCNSVVGSEGFQSIRTEEGLITVPHVGGCQISRNTVIGDNNCVCNSLFEGYTFVGERVKTDNQVHIAHNAFIENDVTLTAGVTLCGTVTIREGAWIAPNTSILNKVKIGKNARTGLGSVVVKDVPEDTMVYGVPAKEH